MLKRLSFFTLGVVLLLGIGGCATNRKRTDLEVQGLKNQVSLLEEQLRAKNDEIADLKVALNQMQRRDTSASRLRVVPEAKYRPSVRQIQKALANAGYNPGAIDGRMGAKTREAIRAFQSANGLTVDGKVGKNTWRLLSRYLYTKTK